MVRTFATFALIGVLFPATAAAQGPVVQTQEGQKTRPVEKITAALTLGRFGLEHSDPISLLGAATALRRLLPKDDANPDYASDFILTARLLARGNKDILAAAALADSTVYRGPAENLRWRSVTLDPGKTITYEVEVSGVFWAEVAAVSNRTVNLDLTVTDKTDTVLCEIQARAASAYCGWWSGSNGTVSIALESRSPVQVELDVFVR